MRPELSIVVVAFRARDDVLRCLRSLKEHGDVAHEILVIDDGSGDGTPEAVQQDFPEARVVAQPTNRGLVAGRNTALGLVRGRKVLMLDADTVVRPGALSSLTAALDADPHIGLVGPRLEFPDGELQLSCRRWPPFLLPVVRRGPLRRLLPDPRMQRRHLMADWDHAEQRPVVYVIGAAQMWRADLPGRIGSYDTRISSFGGEDIDWCLRVWGAGLEVQYVPAAVVQHDFQRVTNRSPFGSKSRRALCDWYYLQAKHARLGRGQRLASARR